MKLCDFWPPSVRKRFNCFCVSRVVQYLLCPHDILDWEKQLRDQNSSQDLISRKVGRKVSRKKEKEKEKSENREKGIEDREKIERFTASPRPLEQIGSSHYTPPTPRLPSPKIFARPTIHRSSRVRKNKRGEKKTPPSPQ